MKCFVTVSSNILVLSTLLKPVQSPGQKRRVLSMTWFHTLPGVKVN